MKRYSKIAINLIIAVIVLAVCIFIVPKVIVFFMPFLIGWLISLIANPLVKFLEEKLKIRRKAVSVMVMVLVLAAVVCISYAVVSKLIVELWGFINDLPNLWQSLEADFKEIGQNMSVLYTRLPDGVQLSFAKIGNEMSSFFASIVEKVGTPTVAAVGSFAKNIPSFIISIIMTALSAYFFTAEKNYLSVKAKIYMPKGIQQKWKIMYDSLRKAVGGYFKAQLKIEMWIYILLVIGLMFLKMKYALLIALGMAILDFLPFFGTGIVLIPWAIVKVLSSDYKMALGLLIIWGVGQLVRQIIQPKIVGDSIGMPPIPTLFLLFIGYKAAGVIGMIIAVPIGIIVVNMYKSGAFDITKNSLRLFVKSINDFRKYDEEDMAYLEDENQINKKK